MFILQDLRSLAVAEGEGFYQLMKVAAPRFKLPSRTYYIYPNCHFHDVQYTAARNEVEAILNKF